MAMKSFFSNISNKKAPTLLERIRELWEIFPKGYSSEHL